MSRARRKADPDSSDPEGNFGGNQLLGGSMSLSPPYHALTNDLHVSTARPASTVVSHGFTVAWHSSPPFGSCRYALALKTGSRSTMGSGGRCRHHHRSGPWRHRRAWLPSALGQRVCLHHAYRPGTGRRTQPGPVSSILRGLLTLVQAADSLVRVTRRAAKNHLTQQIPVASRAGDGMQLGGQSRVGGTVR